MEKLKCEVCKKKKTDTRFEGEVEMNICDGCLVELKRKENEEN